MTTPFAEAVYLAGHLAEWANKGYAVFNPENKPVEDLPVIYGFNNGGSTGWFSAVLIAEDGTPLGGHCCSAEGYMPHDLGIVEGARPDRHETFRKHYPGGYRMDFVGYDSVSGHAALNLAFKRSDEIAARAEAGASS
jgi:hypothetical protein